MSQLLDTTALLVRQDFDLPQEQHYLTEADLLQALANLVKELLRNAPERLYATLYRMDVSEAKVRATLLPNFPFPAHVGIATLIVERQREKARTRLLYSSDDAGDGSW